MDSDMPFYSEDERGNIFDNKGNETTTYDEAPSFRLKKITDLKKLVKNNTYSELHEIEVPDVSMREALVKKERESEYNVYNERDRLLYLHFVFEKGMKNKEVADAANVNQHTARKWKQKYQQNPEEYVPYKMTSLVPSRPVSQLDERHEIHLVSFFDENKRATITNAVDSLTQNFTNLEIKKSRVAEFMKEKYNLSIKKISSHPTARNSPAVIEKRAVWVNEWLEKGMIYLQNCVFLDESGFDINMTRQRA
jgi:transposase